jgi:hypothetical protein
MIVYTMKNIKHATQMVRNLESRGEPRDFIIGFLTATIDGMRHVTTIDELENYLERAVLHSANHQK